MIEAPHYSAAGAKKKSVLLPAALFDGTVNEHVLHRAVVTYLANQRQGTSDTKTRSEVSGGNQKPWRQKGTGRARRCRRGRDTRRRSRQRGKGRGGPPMPDQHRLIVGPVITEKSSAAYQARKEYAFRVDTAATKPQIRAAIETLFKVTVTDVRTLVVRARRRTGGLSSGRAGRRSAWKKAIVTLKEGDAIAVFEG